MDFLTPYLPYLIVAALSWAASSRLNIWLPILDPSTVKPVPRTGRPLIDLVLSVAWRLLPDDVTRDLVAQEAALIAKALDHYNVPPVIDVPKSPV